MSEADASFLRWACRAVLEWEGPNSTVDVPIYHIHGDRDFVLPVKNTKPDVVVIGAGHALSMSHHAQVTQFLKTKMKHHTANKGVHGRLVNSAPGPLTLAGAE